MHLNDKQIEKLSEVLADLGTVGFLGVVIALVTSERLFTEWRVIAAILVWVVCQITSIWVLKGWD